jgi:hypothetical protein
MMTDPALQLRQRHQSPATTTTPKSQANTPPLRQQHSFHQQSSTTFSNHNSNNSPKSNNKSNNTSSNSSQPFTRPSLVKQPPLHKQPQSVIPPDHQTDPTTQVESNIKQNLNISSSSPRHHHQHHHQPQLHQASTPASSRHDSFRSSTNTNISTNTTENDADSLFSYTSSLKSPLQENGPPQAPSAPQPPMSTSISQIGNNKQSPLQIRLGNHIPPPVDDLSPSMGSLSSTSVETSNSFNSTLTSPTPTTMKLANAVSMSPATTTSRVLAKGEGGATPFGELQVQMRHNEDEQQIVVKILKARNLIARDANGFSDPYVKCYLLPGRE